MTRNIRFHCEFYESDNAFFALDVMVCTACSMNWTTRFRARHDDLGSESTSRATLSCQIYLQDKWTVFFYLLACLLVTWDEVLGRYIENSGGKVVLRILCALSTFFVKGEEGRNRTVIIYSAWNYIRKC